MSRLAVPTGAVPIFTGAGGWTLYELPQRPRDSSLWYPFKLMLSPETPARWGERRAFSLTWNPLELRLRRDRERVALEVGHPDLYMRVELALALSYGPEWLRGATGLTDAEIEAERARLRAMANARRRQKTQRSA